MYWIASSNLFVDDLVKWVNYYRYYCTCKTERTKLIDQLLPRPTQTLLLFAFGLHTCCCRQSLILNAQSVSSFSILYKNCFLCMCVRALINNCVLLPRIIFPAPSPSKPCFRISQSSQKESRQSFRCGVKTKNERRNRMSQVFGF